MNNEERNLTKIPHSGEPVVQEFSKPLDQAVAEGLVKTPETSADIPQASEKKKGKKGLIGAGVGLAGLALGGSLFLGLGNNANGGEQAPEPNQPVPTDVAEPGPSEPEVTDNPVDPESLVDVSVVPENVVTHGMFELLDREEQIRMQALDNMSVEGFRAEPEAEQLKFAEFVYRNNLPIFENRMNQNGDGAEHFIEDPTSPEGILRSHNLVLALQTSLHELDTSVGITYDYDTAKKLNILNTVQQDGVNMYAQYDAVIDQMNTSTPYVLLSKELTGFETNEDGTIRVSYDRLGSGEKLQSVFQKQDFETIDGNQSSVYRTILEISNADPRYKQL